MGNVTGKGKDEVGDFTWAGKFHAATGGLDMVKQYIGKHAVHYVGRFDPATHVITGTWSIGPGNTGPFFLKDFHSWMGKHWKGYWIQGTHRGDMECKLEEDGRGNIVGKGKDEVGDFTWAGKINGATLEVDMVKQYIGKHAVHYVGKLNPVAKEITGTWSIGPGNTGTFLLKD
eukprot:TRINITY_DN1903_c0_g1_i3.p1 TRINITY_DN1903_c0_g1~~TRINITY_DN1903_c0_g1_i3.p1  ORF type:complete len:197 (-),score=75.28 TRINITY_DN1903_c0_g1_i3:218-736(-)